MFGCICSVYFGSVFSHPCISFSIEEGSIQVLSIKNSQEKNCCEVVLAGICMKQSLNILIYSVTFFFSIY